MAAAIGSIKWSWGERADESPLREGDAVSSLWGFIKALVFLWGFIEALGDILKALEVLAHEWKEGDHE